MPIQVVLVITTFVLTIIAGILLIPVLTRLKFGQVVRDDGPQSHLSKAGTPTMGGVIFLIPFMLICGYLSIIYPQLLPLMLTTILFGLIGFIDDYIKIVLKRSKGLSARQKMLGLLVISTVFSFYVYRFTDIGTSILIPFTDKMLDFSKVPIPFSNLSLDMEWAFVPFTIIVLLAGTNSVNLTDGLDGLASGISLIIMVFFALVAIIIKDIPVVIFTCTTAGACLGFLAFNLKPAKVFMGDTGSLALGGAISIAGIVLKLPLVLVIVAGVCVIEAISVIIQVTVFKRTGKRFFKMAPIHHHFELMGWGESKVVWTFWGITFLLCMIGLYSIRYSIY